jgi:hypothetical protein
MFLTTQQITEHNTGTLNLSNYFMWFCITELMQDSC